MRIPVKQRFDLLHQLRLLVIAYDNMSMGQKHRLTTAAEIIKNRDWLIKIGRLCCETEARNAAKNASKKDERPQWQSITPPRMDDEFLVLKTFYALLVFVE